MNLKNITKEEIESLSYTDLTYLILSDENKALTTAEIFKKVCELLDYSDSEYAEKIGDYYTSLTIDKRFILLDDAKWDLRKNHAVEINIDDEEEIEEEQEEIEEIDEIEEDAEESLEESIDDEDIDVDDDLDDLSVLPDEELEEEN